MMKIIFDPSIRLAGIGIVPWNRLGPEQWLPQYRIASLYGWDVANGQGPQVVALADAVKPLPILPRLNTGSLLREPGFQAMLERELPGYDLLTYKPIDMPLTLAGRKLLAVGPAYTATIENKVIFRREFADIAPFPNHTIVLRAKLQPTAACLEYIMADRPRVIIQDEQLSGGKGSFIVSDLNSFKATLIALNKLSKHELVVISDVIDKPQELSVQCCATRYGIFVGPLQRQIIAHPELAGKAVGGDKFCGVQVALIDQTAPEYADIKAMALKIGQRLQTKGYKGIFGVDFLLSADNKLFVLEVNARLTGATPLLTALYQHEPEAGIAFYLLHVLELGEYNYTTEGQPTDFERQGSLLIIHSQESEMVRIDNMPQSGSYKLTGQSLLHSGSSVILRDIDAGSFIFQEYTPLGTSVKPGGRLAVLQFPYPVLDGSGALKDGVRDIIRAIRANITLQTV